MCKLSNIILMWLYILVFYWQYVDNRFEAQAKRISCEAFFNTMGKINRFYGCPQEFRLLQILNFYSFLSKIMLPPHATGLKKTSLQEQYSAILSRHMPSVFPPWGVPATSYVPAWWSESEKNEETQLCQIIWKFIQSYYTIEMSKCLNTFSHTWKYIWIRLTRLAENNHREGF